MRLKIIVMTMTAVLDAAAAHLIITYRDKSIPARRYRFDLQTQPQRTAYP